MPSPLFQEVAKLVAAPADSNASQGSGVAISRNGKVLVSLGPEQNGFLGAAWVFVKVADQWTQVQELQPSDPIGTPALSAAQVSDDGAHIFIGGSADHFGQGAIWVFQRSGTTNVWTQQQKIVEPISFWEPFLGSSLALADDVLVAGAPGDYFSTGTVSVFRFNKATGLWVLEQRLLGSSSLGSGQQGFSVAISRDKQVIAFGAPFDGPVLPPIPPATSSFQTGATYVYRYNCKCKRWFQEAKLVAETEPGVLAIQGEQGWAVALNECGSLLAVGAPTYNGEMGAVWIFQLNDCGKWKQIDMLISGNAYTSLGSSVAMSEDGALVFSGAPTPGSGAILVFQRKKDKRSWKLVDAVVPIDAIPPSTIGAFPTTLSLSRHAKLLAFGGPADNSFAGAAWVFRQAS